MAKKTNEKPIYKNAIRLQTGRDINNLLTRITNALIQGEISESRAKSLTYIANTMLQVQKQQADLNRANLEQKIMTERLDNLSKQNKLLQQQIEELSQTESVDNEIIKDWLEVTRPKESVVVELFQE